MHLLKDVEAATARRYSQRISQATYEPEALVLDFDDASSDVFFINSGAVRVIVRNAGGREVILGDLREGDIFGEMAAIDEATRSANITALNRSTVSRMSGAAFREMATEVPRAAIRHRDDA
jgi:CRP/FNR family transcriptional regulator, cyclic AMP receptor protein